MRALLAAAGVKDVASEAFDAAFVHVSAVGERLADRSNERLEFVGDAILGAIVARSLFERYPDASEGELALRKSALVSDNAIAATAERLGFDALLVTGAALESGPSARRRSLLADAFEAFVAVLAGRCGDASATAFVTREHIAKSERAAPPSDDPKTVLQEWSQRRFRTTPQYVERFEGPDHERVFFATASVGEHSAQGRGPSKRAAQREAAAALLAIARERYDDVESRVFSAEKDAASDRSPAKPRRVPASKGARA